MTEPEHRHVRAGAVLLGRDGTLVATGHRGRVARTRLCTSHGLPCEDALPGSSVGRRGQEALADDAHPAADPAFVDAPAGVRVVRAAALRGVARTTTHAGAGLPLPGLATPRRARSTDGS
ncbi:hypothetical protein ACIQVT_12505 [Streptomyces sp. NPDC100445]|uniref:hypothetical protein n=1 Tax=Streptomyces sp. NPDC100445 TaxID=3366102 RepID=UPI003812F449